MKYFIYVENSYYLRSCSDESESYFIDVYSSRREALSELKELKSNLDNFEAIVTNNPNLCETHNPYS